MVMTVPTERASEVVRPFLKWAGGKRRLVSTLLEHVPKRFRVYHEPFVGGGALFFALRPSVAHLSDANRELTDTYLAVRDRVEFVIAKLRTMPYDRDFYYQLRDGAEPRGVTSSWRAARFIYLNKAGYNGMYRVNKAGRFNVPFGRYNEPKICDAPGLRRCSKLLKRTWISCGDFEALHVGPEDVVYFDPPYLPLSKTASFTSYTQDGFDLDDHRRLADFAEGLKRRGTCVIVSNADLPEVRELYAGRFQLKTVQGSRSISCKATGRKSVGELIAF